MLAIFVQEKLMLQLLSNIPSCSGGGSHSEQGAIQIIGTHLYGGKSHFNRKTVKLGGLP